MRSVYELTTDELHELRSRLFHQMLDDGSIEEVFESDVEYEEDIPLDFLQAHYSDTFFVEDDFFCNQIN